MNSERCGRDRFLTDSMRRLGLLLTLAATAAAAPSRPSVVLILTDQQQAGALRYFMGRQWIATPNMDRLAASGVAFTRAYAANPRCVPSRSSMFSGRYPHQTGMQENEKTTGNAFSFPLLGRYFAEGGYRTAYF